MKHLSTLIALAALQVAVSFDDAVSVRVVFNQGKALSVGASCTRPEMSRIQSTLMNAIGKDSKENPLLLLSSSSSLRGKLTKASLDTSFCSDNCRGAAPGTCWVVDDRCTDMRRYWHLATLFRSKFPEVDIYADVPTEDDFNKISRCHSDKQTIENAMLTTLQSSTVPLTHSCKSMLLQHMDLTCVKVPPEDTVASQSQ